MSHHDLPFDTLKKCFHLPVFHVWCHNLPFDTVRYVYLDLDWESTHLVMMPVHAIRVLLMVHRTVVF